MGLLDFTKTLCETKELHVDKDLRTRYYKTSYTKVKEQIERYCQQNILPIENINDEHGEIFIQTAKMHAIVSVIQVTPLETAVDIKVQTYGVFGMHVPRKTVLNIYEHLNKTLTFKGVGLHP